MSLYTDLKAGGYLDATYGVISNVPGNDNCDNYHLFSAEGMELCSWVLWPQYEIFYKACEVEPGLMTRYPGRVDGGISQDEMIGAATMSTYAAERIYEYGKTHWWYFNVSNSPWSLSNWFGRFLDFPAYLHFRATGSINILEQVLWSVMTFLSPISPQGNTSGKLLKWAQLSSMQGHYIICDLAIKWWKNRMAAAYPGGLQQVMQIYFGPTHPLAVNASKGF